MDSATVAIWRDVALIFLVVEGFILLLPAIFLLVYALRGLKRAKGSLLPFLTSTRKRSERVDEGVHAFFSFLVNSIIRTISGGAFVLEVLKALLRR